jgi:dCTP deaminase
MTLVKRHYSIDWWWAPGDLSGMSLAREGVYGRIGSPDREPGLVDGYFKGGGYEIPDENIQPARLDLRLGDKAYRMRCSFLPGRQAVLEKAKGYVIDEVSLRGEGAVLETKRPYLIPLTEELQLPANLRGKANPKSSTGRSDVFTRLITDRSDRFDEIAPGYSGKLYLEVVPLSFPIRVRENLCLNQLRLSIGRATLSDDEIRAFHEEQTPLLCLNGRPVPTEKLSLSDGMSLTLDLAGDTGRAPWHLPSGGRESWLRTLPRS